MVGLAVPVKVALGRFLGMSLGGWSGAALAVSVEAALYVLIW